MQYEREQGRALADELQDYRDFIDSIPQDVFDGLKRRYEMQLQGPAGHSYILFTPLAPYETADTMEQLCENFNRMVDTQEIDPLLLIPIAIHDFLCIHPFNDGNGRMSRLLTTLLLY